MDHTLSRSYFLAMNLPLLSIYRCNYIQVYAPDRGRLKRRGVSMQRMPSSPTSSGRRRTPGRLTQRATREKSVYPRGGGGRRTWTRGHWHAGPERDATRVRARSSLIHTRTCTHLPSPQVLTSAGGGSAVWGTPRVRLPARRTIGTCDAD